MNKIMASTVFALLWSVTAAQAQAPAPTTSGPTCKLRCESGKVIADFHAPDGDPLRHGEAEPKDEAGCVALGDKYGPRLKQMHCVSAPKTKRY
jgi:hypothetical protein